MLCNSQFKLVEAGLIWIEVGFDKILIVESKIEQPILAGPRFYFM